MRREYFKTTESDKTARVEGEAVVEVSVDDINQFNVKLMQMPAGKALLEILNWP